MFDPHQKDIDEAIAYFRTITPFEPDVAVILGSGLGALANAVKDPVIIEAANVPHLPAAGVAGHKGRFVFGTLGGRSVVVIQGRLHMYEGYDAAKTVFPIRIAHALGATSLFVTNASGGINPEFVPGTLMWITSHINHSGGNPPDSSHGSPSGIADWPARTWSDYYDLEWTARAETAARKLNIQTQRGT